MDEVLNQNNVIEMNAVQKCINIFFSPKQTFQSIDRKLHLVLPLVLIAITALVIGLATVHLKLTNETIQRESENAQIELYKFFGMSEQQISQALDKNQPAKNPIFQYGSAGIFSIFGAAFFLLLMTVIYWLLGNLILRSKTRFDKMLTVFAYSALISYFGNLLRILIINLQTDLKAGFHLANILGLPSGNDFISAFIYTIAMFISLFDIWTLIVLTIGMAVIYKSSTVKAGVLVFSVWAFFVLLFAVGMAVATLVIGFHPILLS